MLFGLTGAVLLAHLVVLQAPMSAALSPELSEPEPIRVFTLGAVTPAAAPRPAPTKQPSKPVPGQPGAAKPSISTASTSPLPTLEPPSSKPALGASPDPGQESVVEADPSDPSVSVSRPLREPLALLPSFELPGSVRLKYQVTSSKFPFSLNSELLWQQDGQSYGARLEFSAFGLSRVQTSRGQITQQGLAPLRFSDKYRSEVAAHFVREQGKVSFSANTPDAPLLAGAQDRLSILLQLAGLIAGAPDQYPSATTIAIQTIGPRDADTWLFTVGSAETLTLPGGQQVALKLLRNPRQPYDQQVELWLAPALGYLPVRLRITDANGDYVDQQWLAHVLPP